jgi:hypothetical protein
MVLAQTLFSTGITLASTGAVIAAPQAYEIPENTTTTTYNGPAEQNLGYQLWTQQKGVTPSIYSPSTRITSLTVQKVNSSHITTATLTLNAFFNAVTHTPDMTWGISYRFNGGTLEKSYPDGRRLGREFWFLYAVMPRSSFARAALRV